MILMNRNAGFHSVHRFQMLECVYDRLYIQYGNSIWNRNLRCVVDIGQTHPLPFYFFCISLHNSANVRVQTVTDYQSPLY